MYRTAALGRLLSAVYSAMVLAGFGAALATRPAASSVDWAAPVVTRLTPVRTRSAVGAHEVAGRLDGSLTGCALRLHDLLDHVAGLGARL